MKKLVLGAAVVLLAACGGGDEKPTTPTTTTPTAPTTSTTKAPVPPQPKLIAAGVTVGRTLVGGLTAAEAREVVKTRFARPLTLSGGPGARIDFSRLATQNRVSAGSMVSSTPKPTALFRALPRS